jgi:predicted lysophospholipase L1 biosynthesis ABC-type transport system permease subunit
MNIMLVSVTERTREIGLRMAVGAQPFAIELQFLTEAVTLSLLGGLIGVLFGIGLARLVAVFANFNAIVDVNSILLAFAVSCVIGLFFGFYPAYRAAVLDPIDALRYQRVARRDAAGPLAHRAATGDFAVACRDRRPEFRARCRLSHRRNGESPPRALRFCAGQETSSNHPRPND